MDKKGIILAARYAKAWLQVYPNAITVNDIPKLLALADVLIYHTIGLNKEQLAILLDEFSCAAALHRLMVLLITDRRVFLLAPVLNALAEYTLRSKNIQYMMLESSHEISKVDKERVVDWAAQQLDADIIYQYKINPALIMGVAIYSDVYAWECSARKALASYARLMPSGVNYGN